MSVYSGFATRHEESFYNKLLEKLITILAQKIIELNPRLLDPGEEKFLKYIRKIHLTMTCMEKRKYLDPKYSSATVKLLEHYGINTEWPRRTFLQNGMVTFGYTANHGQAANETWLFDNQLSPDLNSVMSDRLYKRKNISRPTSEKVVNRGCLVREGVIEEKENLENQSSIIFEESNKNLGGERKRGYSGSRLINSKQGEIPRSRGSSQAGANPGEYRAPNSPIRRIMTAGGSKRKGSYVTPKGRTNNRRTPPMLRAAPPFQSIGGNYNFTYLPKNPASVLISPYTQKQFTKEEQAMQIMQKRQHRSKKYIRKHMNIDSIIHCAKQTTFNRTLEGLDTQIPLGYASSKNGKHCNNNTQTSDTGSSIQTNNL